MKTVRIDFSKGMNLVGEKRLLPEGYCLLADNVDLRSGTMRPFHFPDFFKTAPSGTTRIWEYRGKWYNSALWRDYQGEVVGQKERVYFTETGPGATYANKFVDGTQAKLGTPPPRLKLTVAKGTDLQNISLTATSSPSANPSQTLGTSSANSALVYRVASKNSNGVIQPASGPASITLAGPSDVVLTWTAIPGAASYIIYGRINDGSTLGKLMETSLLTFRDDGSLTLDNSFTPIIATNRDYTYIYTYIRDVNGMTDESGPSPVSSPVTATATRIITRNSHGDGSFVADSVNTFTNHTPPISSAASSTAGALNTWAILPAQSHTVVVTTVAHTLKNGDSVGMVGLLPSTLTTLGATVIVPAPSTVPNNVRLEVGTFTAGVLPTIGTAMNYTVTAVRGDMGSGVTNNTHGAQTVASVSVPISSPGPGFLIKVKCNITDDCDGYYVYRDGVFRGFILKSSGTVAESAFYTDYGQAASWAGASPPTAPTTDQTSTHAFFLEGIIASPTEDYPGTLTKTMPTVVVRPTTTVTITGVSLTGMTAGGTYSVRMSAWANGSMNGIFTATIVSAGAPITFTVPTFEPAIENSVVTPYKVEFGTLNSSGVDEAKFYKYWNLYRTGDTQEYLLVAQIPISQTTYTDVLTVDQLGDPPTSYYWDNGMIVVFEDPPRDLHGIEFHYGMIFGISENTVRWTPIGMPDAWPSVFSISFDYEPLALASYGSFLVVLCSDAIYLLNGFQPSALTRSKSQAEDGIIAPRSVQKSPEGLLYLSRRGIMLFRDMQASCISEMKIPGTFFIAPSSLKTAIPFWWYPSEATYNYSAATFNQSGGYGDAGNSLVNPAVLNQDNAVIEGPIYNIRSFYYQNKYFLFWSDYT